MAEDQEKVRLEKLAELNAGGIDPYGSSYPGTVPVADAVSAFDDDREVAVKVAGRLTAIRGHGKAVFADLTDWTGKIQVYLRLNILGEEGFGIVGLLDMGDIIGVEGKLFRTRSGEITVEVKSLAMLTKALLPLPEKWHGLKDVEQRFRKRYIDIISNSKVAETFRLRSALISETRTFLENEGFVEVETPMMHSVPGGATARPFVTHHNALDIDLYLRIAPELYLKRLLVAGMRRVYEINRNFRNEGISPQHNPEFTMVEIYEAYGDYNTMMDLTERLVSCIANKLHGGSRITYQDNEIDLSPPWPRKGFLDAIKEFTGEDFSSMESAGEARSAAKKIGAEIEDWMGYGKVVDEVMKTFVRPKLIRPTFLIDYPVELSPLAKFKPGSSRIVERFQPYIGGMEIGNAFTELNDPEEQVRRFNMQAEDRQKGDEEAQRFDEDFITALKHGMPPAGGLGIGIDRLVMLMTDSPSIREVVLFPLLRPRQD